MEAIQIILSRASAQSDPQFQSIFPNLPAIDYLSTSRKRSPMWIEEVTLENVKCFQSQTIPLGKAGKPYPWVTFLGENGTGKTTVLQAIGLMMQLLHA
jgi:type IV secretory pathway ATPase VirB11/archaellum biosynthesis ATPase